MYKHNDKKHINYVTASFFVPFLLFCPVLLHFFHSNPTTSPLDPRTHKRTRITGKRCKSTESKDLTLLHPSINYSVWF